MSRTRRTRIDAPGQTHPLFWALLTDDVPLDDWRRRDSTMKWRFWEFNADMELGGGIPSEGYIRAMWEANRDYILHHWTREKPGTRPQSFWRFEVEGHDAQRDPDTHVCVYGPPPGWTDLAYLDRYKLLTDSERRRLPGVAAPGHGARVRVRNR